MKRVGDIKVGDKIFDKDKNITVVLAIHSASRKRCIVSNNFRQWREV